MAAIVLALCPAGCSDTLSEDKSNSGEPSDPLEHCSSDSQCTSGTSCICGICTVECADDPDQCEEFGESVACATGDSPNAVCSGPDGAPDSMCASECSTNNECKGLDACTGGFCEPQISRDDHEPWEDRCGTGDFPICCPDPSEPGGFDLRSDPQPRMNVLFEGFEPPAEPWTATWQGVVELSEPSELNCPRRAEELGVLCEVSHAIRFKSPNFDLVIGLPRETLNALAEPGTDVELRSGSTYPDEFSIHDTSGRVLLDIVSGPVNVYHQETVEFQRTNYTIEMTALAEDLSNIPCMSPKDECFHEYAPRSVFVNSSAGRTEFEPNSMGAVEIDEEQYVLRHFSSHQRLPHDEEECADAYGPHLRYALVKSAPQECSSQDVDACPNDTQCVHTGMPTNCSTDFLGTCEAVPESCEDDDLSNDICACDSSESWASECHARMDGYAGKLGACP